MGPQRRTWPCSCDTRCTRRRRCFFLHPSALRAAHGGQRLGPRRDFAMSSSPLRRLHTTAHHHLRRTNAWQMHTTRFLVPQRRHFLALPRPPARVKRLPKSRAAPLRPAGQYSVSRPSPDTNTCMYSCSTSSYRRTCAPPSRPHQVQTSLPNAHSLDHLDARRGAPHPPGSPRHSPCAPRNIGGDAQRLGPSPRESRSSLCIGTDGAARERRRG